MTYLLSGTVGLFALGVLLGAGGMGLVWLGMSLLDCAEDWNDRRRERAARYRARNPRPPLVPPLPGDRTWR